MKKYIFGMFWIAVFIMSCGEGKKSKDSGINDKKAELEKLKTQQQEVNAKITSLEAELSKIDSSYGAAQNIKLVSITPVQNQNFSHYIDLQGSVEAENTAYVAPPNGQGGVVTALYVKQGDNVRKGQVLARLDDQLIRQQIAPIEVQLASAEDTYRRTKNLWDQSIGTYQNLLTAQTQVENLKRNIDIYKKQISLMTVTAPASGVADQVNVRVGEAFIGVAGNVPQISIVNTNNLKLVTNVPENYLGRVKIGSELEVVLPDENNRTLTAKINVIGKTIDLGTRSFYTEARLPAGARLKPNQVAKVRIKDYSKNDAISIPVNTLQNDEKGKFVLVAAKEKDGLVAKKRVVTVGELYENTLEVKSGLQIGDQLITEGFQGLYEGQPITTQAK
ncbi:MAG: efflux RND transporter periplasmic adaptor subunit [Chitinophagaceae bacterium]|nr:efflux RND transporter periplasmic adaptor subunit [Chitinophagaceae bacterium]